MMDWRRFSNPLRKERILNPAQHQALCANADDLASYLKSDMDPYDFSYLVYEWLGGGEDKEVEELSDAERARFSTWLKYKRDYVMQHYGGPGAAGRLPAYIFFDGVRRMPAGSWLIHFSRAEFTSFERGTTLEGLAISTWKKTKDVADCRTNLTRDIGLFDVVWGFALDVKRRFDWSDLSRNYGPNVVIFQTDCAVSAYHTSDEQEQAIFPLCSEYNVTRAWFREGSFLYEDNWYDSPKDVIEALR